MNNLNTNSDAFPQSESADQKLVDEKLLMPINDEYKLQTKIGAEWSNKIY